MSVGSADLHKAIATVWQNGGLQTAFEQLWTEANKSIYLTLNEEEAAPGTPFPYCVFEQIQGTVVGRSSRETKSKNIERDVPFRFTVYSAKLDSDTRSAKELAADLVEMILWRFGGHPTQTPMDLVLDYGKVLNVQYQNDYPMRQGDQEYSWIVDYIIKIDSPVRTG